MKPFTLPAVMKNPLRLLFALVLPVLAALPLAAQAQAENDPVGYGTATAVKALVQVQIEFIELPHANLSELMLKHSPGKSRELRERVQELVKAGTAQIVETQIVTGRSGEKLSSEAVQELIFPTEYQMWELVNPRPGGGLGATVQPPTPIPFVTPFIPTSFETRNIGSILEVEPTLSADGKVIDMLIDPELTWHTGSSIWLEEKDNLGNIARIQMPEIYTMKFHSALSLRAGSILFTAALSPKDAAGHADLSRKVMVFVKADVVPAE